MNNLTVTQVKTFKNLQRFGLYLCGPILDCDDHAVHYWRDRVKHTLIAYPVTIYDPSSRDYRQTLKEAQTYEDIEKIDEEIITHDTEEITLSHAIIAGCYKPSAGSSMEIKMAWDLKRFVVSIVPDRMATSAWIRYHSTVVVENYPDAILELRKVFLKAFGVERTGDL
jgi:hypothetical protein